jgi:hypothetical protein
MKTTVKDFLGACLLGAVLGALFAYSIPAEAQQIQMTNSAGYSMGTVQINGNTAQFVNPMGYTTQTATIYPNQVVITDSSNRSITVGQPSYTVPPSPPTPTTPRVLQ